MAIIATLRRGALAGLAALALQPVVCPAATPADLILTGGKVITVDPADDLAEAVAIAQGRIVAVGSAAAIAALRGPETTVIDLAGHVLLPGFIDSHSHVSGMAQVETFTVNIQAPPLPDAAAIIARLKDAEKRLRPGEWLFGQGTYNQIMPTREALDAAFPDRSVALSWSVHDNLLNHAADLAIKADATFPDPPKGSTGRFERNAAGEIVITRDAAVPIPMPRLSYPQLKQALRDVLDGFYLRKGVTTVSDMSEPAAYRAYAELADLVVLGGDPLTTAPDRLGDIPVLMTFVGGELRYRHL